MPVREVASLPATCKSGEMVWLREGGDTGSLRFCSGTDNWSEVGGGAANAVVAFSGATTVDLDHNRRTRDVLVSCYDTGGAVVQPDRVVVMDINRVRIAFAVPQSGACVANSSGGSAGGAISGGAVASVFGRAGDITATAGDYSFAQITGTAGLSQGGTNQSSWTAARCVQVSADGSRLESASGACGTGTGAVASIFGRTGAITATAGDYSFAQIAGTAGLSQGGTNQTAWTGARCVQVSADGSRLESATGACRTGTDAVPSVFGRTGAIAAATGDYTFAQIAGTVGVNQGGTGGTTAPAARVNLFPSMPGQQGKVLMVNAGGTDAEWTTPPVSSFTAGSGLVIDGNVISVDSAVVPGYLTGAASIADWDGGMDRVPAASCSERSFTLNGVLPVDAIIAGWPTSLPVAVTGLMYAAANNLVVVRLCNVTAADAAIPDGLTFRATIVRTF
jgi:hypothetical protein